MPLGYTQGFGAKIGDTGNEKQPFLEGTQLGILNATQNSYFAVSKLPKMNGELNVTINTVSSHTIATALNPPEKLLIYAFIIWCANSVALTLRDGATDIFFFGTQGSTPVNIIAPGYPFELPITNGTLSIFNPSGGAIQITYTLFAQFDNG